MVVKGYGAWPVPAVSGLDSAQLIQCRCLLFACADNSFATRWFRVTLTEAHIFEVVSFATVPTCMVVGGAFVPPDVEWCITTMALASAIRTGIGGLVADVWLSPSVMLFCTAICAAGCTDIRWVK